MVKLLIYHCLKEKRKIDSIKFHSHCLIGFKRPNTWGFKALHKKQEQERKISNMRVQVPGPKNLTTLLHCITPEAMRGFYQITGY